MVAATLDIYNTIADNLLPTPAKSHYTFNLRDLSKVFQVRGAHIFRFSTDQYHTLSDPRSKHRAPLLPGLRLFRVGFSTPNALGLR